jgi:hypothetical protein
VLIGQTGTLQLPVGRQLQVRLVVRVVHLAELAEGARRLEAGQLEGRRVRIP